MLKGEGIRALSIEPADRTSRLGRDGISRPGSGAPRLMVMVEWGNAPFSKRLRVTQMRDSRQPMEPSSGESSSRNPLGSAVRDAGHPHRNRLLSILPCRRVSGIPYNPSPATCGRFRRPEMRLGERGPIPRRYHGGRGFVPSARRSVALPRFSHSTAGCPDRATELRSCWAASNSARSKTSSRKRGHRAGGNDRPYLYAGGATTSHRVFAVPSPS